MDYMEFASFYDALTRNVEYEKRADRICCLIRQYLQTETDGTLLTDLACGSGSLSEALARRGIRLSRRTVAKYRSQMDITSSFERKNN